MITLLWASDGKFSGSSSFHLAYGKEWLLRLEPTSLGLEALPAVGLPALRWRLNRRAVRPHEISLSCVSHFLVFMYIPVTMVAASSE